MNFLLSNGILYGPATTEEVGERQVARLRKAARHPETFGDFKQQMQLGAEPGGNEATHFTSFIDF
ncbi:hypothetical protein BY996DRAFT_6489845, partial [Phakopsora pachyrhizi]